MPEKRRSKRFAKRLKVKFGEGNFAHTGFTENISASGLFVVTTWLPKIGAHVQLQVFGANDQPVYFEAEVMRVVVVEPQLRQLKRGGFGVRFFSPAEVVTKVMPRGVTDQGVAVRYDTPHQFAEAFSRELAQGGVFLKTRTKPVLNSTLQLEIQLGFADRIVEVPSRVVHVGSADERGVDVALVFADKEQTLIQLRALLPG